MIGTTLRGVATFAVGFILGAILQTWYDERERIKAWPTH